MKGITYTIVKISLFLLLLSVNYFAQAELLKTNNSDGLAQSSELPSGQEKKEPPRTPVEKKSSETGELETVEKNDELKLQEKTLKKIDETYRQNSSPSLNKMSRQNYSKSDDMFSAEITPMPEVQYSDDLPIYEPQLETRYESFENESKIKTPNIEILPPTNTPTYQENLHKAEKPVKESENSSSILLFVCFELFQIFVLAFLSFRFNEGKKTLAAMTAILALLLTGLAWEWSFGITSTKGISTVGLLTIFAFYAYAAIKISIYTIISLIPKSLLANFLILLSTGVLLIFAYFKLLPNNYALIGFISGLGIIVIGNLVALGLRIGRKGKNMHGSARFMEDREWEEFEIEEEPGSFILAPEDPQRRHRRLVIPRKFSIMHGLILGGSGTGKSRGYFMRNCSEMTNTSIVVTDPKSELWNYTSGFHEKPMRFAPTEPEASFSFNWIPLCREARMAELCARAIMTAGNTERTDQFWIDSETAFLSALFAHTATTMNPTPLAAYNLFTRNKPDELLQILSNSSSYFAREQAIIFEQTDSRIKGAIVPAVASRMQFMRDEKICLFTSGSTEAPDFGKIRHTPTAIYWCLREQDIARLRPLSSLFFTVLLEQIANEEFSEEFADVPINLFLDEFANIGKIPDFEMIITLARGRNVGIWLGIQSLSQLAQTYGNEQSKTILNNCATKIALHGLDFNTADYISKMLGEKTESHTHPTVNVGIGGLSVGAGAVNHRRQLLTPDEVARLDENEAIVRISNKYPMRIYKEYYDKEPLTAPIIKKLPTIIDAGEEEPEEVAI